MQALATLLLGLGALAGGLAAPKDPGALTVRFVHTNDMHSRFEETSLYSSICNAKDKENNKCYGGFARVATKVREARKVGQETDTPTFFLNAGDTYQGTRLFKHYKYKIVLKFLNILRPDVVCLGNHEFDNGVQGLVPYLGNVTFPVVAANLDISAYPELQALRNLRKSTILEAKGQKIGVVGYVTPDTKFLSHPEQINFLDEVVSVRAEAQRLKAMGCQIIVALGHSGYEVDQRIGREVEEVDLVIGGHTNTFLYTGPKPSSEEIEGLYPTVVIQPSGRKAYIVQAYAYTKYLGDLTVDFDSRGEITHISGNPVLLDGSIPKAPDVEEELALWLAPIITATKVVGVTKVLLQGDEKVCRLQECNFGNFVTDAMVYHHAQSMELSDGWTDAPMAIYQSGGIRSSIGSIGHVEVTSDDVQTAFPFESSILKVKLNASKLREVLEWSVHDRLSMTTTEHGGCFLQMSGLKVTYDIEKPVGSRVESVMALCGHCNVPDYQEIDPQGEYTVLLPQFLYEGGDGFSMLKGIPYTDTSGKLDAVVTEYLNRTGPVYPGLEGRIDFVFPGSKTPSSGAVARGLSAALLLVSSCLALLNYA